MINRKNMTLMTAFIIAVSLISSCITTALITKYYNDIQFETAAGIFDMMIQKEPDLEEHVLSALKDYTKAARDGSLVEKDSKEGSFTEGSFIKKHGYTPHDFLNFMQKNSVLFAAIGFFLGCILLLIPLWYFYKKSNRRIKQLTGYLEKINVSETGMLMPDEEDAFSGLQDEICKTVTTLYQMRDKALKAKTNFAENLSNIAHQMKTPITAASLFIQTMKEEENLLMLGQVERQLNRLNCLEESLLLLSRIDAGTLPFHKTKVDIFTVLTLAAENLEEMLLKENISIEIPKKDIVEIEGDMEWTMEAIMNLFKNCMEHSPNGSVIHCDYEKNPLYAQIRIWDEGNGFLKEDLPHLFERFYRGRAANAGGIGIGLALSKAILEMENGMISAKNLNAGGACFEIRIYCH